MPLTLSPPLTPVGQVICTVAGAYSFLGTKTSTSATLGNGTTRAAAIFVPEPVTLDRIGCEITSAGEAGSVVRLGIWADAGTVAVPGALVLDAGTVAADSTGVKEITISQVLAAGYYWLSGTVQGAPTIQPTVRTHSSGFEPVGGLYQTVASSVSGTGCGTTRTNAGALSATWGAFSANAGSTPRVFVRVV